MAKCVKGKPKGLLVKEHAQTLPSIWQVHLPRGAACNAVQFGLGKEGCLPKARIGDCDQEPDATCPTVYARNVPWLQHRRLAHVSVPVTALKARTRLPATIFV